MFVPERLQIWKRPTSYVGPDWPDYYSAGVGRSRESDCLEESNFHAMLSALGITSFMCDDGSVTEGESRTAFVVREMHWAVGWVEWIAIHKSDERALRIADDCRQRLDDYPILDEEDFSRREDHECELTWSQCFSPSDRIRKLREDGCTKGFRELRAAVNGDWGSAAQLLSQPSEIIY